MKTLLAILMLAGSSACAPDPGGECPEGGCGGGGGDRCATGSAEWVGSDGCQTVGWQDCGEGFTAAEGGWGCDAILPTAPCSAGTRAVLGSETCEPVGWSDCPTGFVTAPSGWGCSAVVTAQSCGNAAKPVLGSTDCVPIGDCDDFPPGNATLFVDSAFASGELDATHHATIGEALAVATAGAVIAIERGTYPEALALASGITLVGRCAEEVIIQPPSASAPTIALSSDENVILRDLTIRGGNPGIEASYASTLTAERVVIAANTIAGMQLFDVGTEVTLRDSLVRDSLPDGQGRYGLGIAAGYGAQITIEDSALTNNAEHALYADWDASTITGTRLIVSHTQTRPNGLHGNAVRAMHTGQVALSQSLLAHNHSMTVSVGHAGSAVSLTEVEIHDTQLGQDSAGTPLAHGVVVADGASVELIDSAVRQSPRGALLAQLSAEVEISGSVLEGPVSGGWSPALTAGGGSSATVENTAAVGNRGMGLAFTNAGPSTVTNSLIAETTEEADDAAGIGILVESSSAFDADDLTIRNNSGAGMLVDNGATATIDHSVISGTRYAVLGAEGGHGLAAMTTGRLEVSDCVLVENTHASLLAAGGGVLTVERTVVRDTQPRAAGDFGYGVTVFDSSLATLTDVSLHGNRAASLLVAMNSQVAATRLTVGDTELSPDGWGRAVSAGFGSLLTLEESALLGSTQAGLAAFASAVTVRRSLILGTAQTASQEYGHGIEALESATLVVEDSAIEENDGAGIFVAAAQGKVGTSRIVANHAGIHTQEETVLTTVTELPAVVPTGELVIDEASLLLDNDSEIGSGTLPISSPDPSPL